APEVGDVGVFGAVFLERGHVEGANHGVGGDGHLEGGLGYVVEPPVADGAASFAGADEVGVVNGEGCWGASEEGVIPLGGAVVAVAGDVDPEGPLGFLE